LPVFLGQTKDSFYPIRGGANLSFAHKISRKAAHRYCGTLIAPLLYIPRQQFYENAQ